MGSGELVMQLNLPDCLVLDCIVILSCRICCLNCSKRAFCLSIIFDISSNFPSEAVGKLKQIKYKFSEFVCQKYLNKQNFEPLVPQVDHAVAQYRYIGVI